MSGVTTGAAAPELFAGVVGQDSAVAHLQAAAAAPLHAYLFVGPSGTGTRAAARAFAAALLCREGGCTTCRDCRLALSGGHPDLEEIEPERTRISAEQARAIRERAALASVEGGRRVIVVDEVETVVEAGPMLLKTLEEPRAGVVFVLLAASVPPALQTIASRCARVDFVPVEPAVIEAALVAEGVPAGRAAAAAASAGGLVERARLLATDEGVARRADAWRTAPARLDGSGAAVAVVVAELFALVEEAATPLRERHAADAGALEERVAQLGERRSGRRELDAHQRREVRRHRLEELRAGLRILAGRYAEAAATGGADVLAAVDAINAASAALVRNPNEQLLLHDLFLRLPHLTSSN